MLFLSFSLSNSGITESLIEVNEHVQCITQHRGDNLEKKMYTSLQCVRCVVCYTESASFWDTPSPR